MNTVKKYPVITFTVLAYLVSWICWIGVIVAGLKGPLQGVLFIAGGFGPMISAVVMTGVIEGRSKIKPWLKKIFRVRVGIKWYLLALLIPVVIAVLVFGLLALVGEYELNFTEVAPVYLYPVFLIYIFFLGGGQEEPGWRGFALPRLLKNYSPLSSSLFIGVVWTFWHVPLFFLEGSVQQDIPFFLYALNTFAFTIIFTVLYMKAESVLPAMLLHGGLNAVGNYVPLEEGIGAAFPYLVVASWVIALVLVFMLSSLKEFVNGQSCYDSL